MKNGNECWDDDVLDFDEDWDEGWDDTLFRQNGRKKYVDYGTAISRLVNSLFEQQEQQAM